MPRDQALRNLVDRTNVSDLRHFVFALLQAQKHGVSISQVLRVQTLELRVKRRQRRGEGHEGPGQDPPLPAGCTGHLHRAVGPAGIQIMRNWWDALNMTTQTTTLDLPSTET